MAGRLPEKTPGTARGKPSGESDKLDAKSIEAVRPAEAIITQTMGHNHNKKGAKATHIEVRDLVRQDYNPIDTFKNNNVGGSGIPGPPDTPSLRNQDPNSCCGTIKTKIGARKRLDKSRVTSSKVKAKACKGSNVNYKPKFADPCPRW